MKTIIAYDDVFLMFLIIEFSTVIQFKVIGGVYIVDCLFKL